MKKLIILCLVAMTSFSFAHKRDRIEIAEVKKTADLAMVAVAEIREALDDIRAAQQEMLRTQRRFALMLNDVSPTRLEETDIQLAYLTEAFRDLYTRTKYLELLPIIQESPVIKTPKRPAGFSVSMASERLFGGDEYALFSRGLDSFRKKFYDESRQIMRQVISNFPDGQFTDRAYFWIAESHFAEKNYLAALSVYEKVLGYKTYSKEDDAQYKIAVCYLLLNEPDKAFEEFTKLVQRYPASDFVPLANEALREISIKRNNRTAVSETAATTPTFAVETATTETAVEE